MKRSSLENAPSDTFLCTVFLNVTRIIWHWGDENTAKKNFDNLALGMWLVMLLTEYENI